MITLLLSLFCLSTGLVAGILLGFNAGASKRKSQFPLAKLLYRVSSPFKPGEKVVPHWGNWNSYSKAVSLHTPQPGNIYVIREVKKAADGTVLGIKLIGVAELRNGQEQEPFWDVRGFKLLKQQASKPTRN